MSFMNDDILYGDGYRYNEFDSFNVNVEELLTFDELIEFGDFSDDDFEAEYDETLDIDNPMVQAMEYWIEHQEEYDEEYDEESPFDTIRRFLDYDIFDRARYDEDDKDLHYRMKIARRSLLAGDGRFKNRMLSLNELKYVFNKVIPLKKHKKHFKNQIIEELLMVALHPSRIERHLSFYNCMDEAFDNL